MWARQVIEDRLQKARENLDVLDKSLKRITGNSDGPKSTLRRRVGAPQSGLASVKSRLHGGTPTQTVRAARLTPRADLDQSKEYESEDEAENSGQGPLIKSNVTVTSKPTLTPEHANASKLLSDSTTKERGKRFFGILTQTLHSFQEKENEKKPTLDKRAEIEKKVEAAEKMEKAEAAVERREMFRERLMREEEIAQLNAKMDRAKMLEDWESAMQKTKGNIITNARPPIFYRPKQFNKRLTELQKRTERYIDGLIWEREEEMKQELHLLPSEEQKSNGTAEHKSSPVKEHLSVSVSFSTGKVTKGLSEKTSTGKQSTTTSSEDRISGKVAGMGDLEDPENPTSLAEELGAPGEDIENLLVEAEPVKKDANTPSIASAVVMPSESTSSARTEDDAKLSEGDKSSLNKKQRNYRQRSKSLSSDRGRKKRKDSSPVRKQSSRSENKDETSKRDSKVAEKRKSEKLASPDKTSRDRRKRSESTDKKKRKSETQKEEKSKKNATNRSPERVKPGRSRKSGSVEKKDPVRKQRKRSSSESSSSSVEERNKKSENARSVREKSVERRSSNKNVLPKQDDTSFVPETKTFDSTFGSELKKVKQLTSKEPSKPVSNVLEAETKSSSASQSKIQEQSSESAHKLQAKTSDFSEKSKSLGTSLETTKNKLIETPEKKPSAVAMPTHSPLKSTDLFKSINPSLLPVDHENLTFKITSVFQSAPTPPVLTYPSKEQTNSKPSEQTSEKTAQSLASKSNGATLKPETSDFYPVSSDVSKTKLAEQLKASDSSQHEQKSGKPEEKKPSNKAVSSKPAGPVKKRSGSSSSSSSDSDESSPERRDRKSRRSPGRRRPRRSSHKRRRSHSRRRHGRVSSPRRKSTSRHRRRRPASRERRRRGGSRRRRSPPTERRRKKASPSSSSGSSSSGSESSSGSSRSPSKA